MFVTTTPKTTTKLEVGPRRVRAENRFNEVENDLEVVGFTVTDSNSDALTTGPIRSGRTTSNENQTLLAEGRVRMEGIANQWIQSGEAEAAVTLTAVPPKNISGGPMNGPVNPVELVEVHGRLRWSRGWFSVLRQRPTALDNEVPSNTFLELTPSLTRRAGLTPTPLQVRTKPLFSRPTRFLHDTVHPTVDALTALDSGQEVARRRPHLHVRQRHCSAITTQRPRRFGEPTWRCGRGWRGPTTQRQRHHGSG